MRLLTLKQVCERLQVCRQTAYRLADRGELRIVKVGRSTKFVESGVDEYINKLVGARQQTLMPWVHESIQQLVARVDRADPARPEELPQLIADLRIAQQQAALAGLEEAAARISVVEDQLIEKLSKTTDVFPEGQGMGGGRPAETSVPETKVFGKTTPKVDKSVRQAVATHRADWKGVPEDVRERVRQNAIDKGVPLTRKAKQAAWPKPADPKPVKGKATGKQQPEAPKVESRPPADLPIPGRIPGGLNKWKTAMLNLFRCLTRWRTWTADPG